MRVVIRAYSAHHFTKSLFGAVSSLSLHHPYGIRWGDGNGRPLDGGADDDSQVLTPRSDIPMNVPSSPMSKRVAAKTQRKARSGYSGRVAIRPNLY